MTAGNEKGGIQPVVFNKHCRYQSFYHTSLFSDSRRECRMFKYERKKFVLEMENPCLR